MDKNLKLILKVDEDNISAFINGYQIVIAWDILKKDFSLLGESKSVIMLHKYNLNHYYELDILRKDFELLSICVSLCIETLLFFDEKKSKKEKNFFTKYILNNKKVFGSLRETFSTNVKNEK